ncbi:MAG TPA: hypothetical protein PLU14_03610 [Caldisericia bacterium]|nr:hypothetical protein [Caldisericia bacterium]
MRKPDLLSKDWNCMDARERSIACKQMFYESTKRRCNRKEPGTGCIVPWDVQELYEYSKEHRISNDDIERIFKEAK